MDREDAGLFRSFLFSVGNMEPVVLLDAYGAISYRERIVVNKQEIVLILFLILGFFVWGKEVVRESSPLCLFSVGAPRV